MIINKHKGAIDSLFGLGNTFKGDFELVGPLRVDGNLIGQVTSNSRLHISKSGKGEGSIIAKIIEIGGEFFGDLFATDKVILKSTAYVKAKITSRYLEVEEGAFYSGQCKVTTTEMTHPSEAMDDTISRQELAETSI